MKMQTLEFQFITGLKRAIFRNARLRGSWDSNGLYSDSWTEIPMQEEKIIWLTLPMEPTMNLASIICATIWYILLMRWCSVITITQWLMREIVY